MSTTAGDDEQRKRVADDEGSYKEGGKGDGNGDEGGGRVTATSVKKREEGEDVKGDGDEGGGQQRGRRRRWKHGEEQ